MERKLKILSYLTLIFTALVGLGEILTYVILGDIDLASIMIFALVISFTFSLLFFFHKNPYFIIGTILPYLILSIIYLSIGYGHKAHWIFYIYDVGIAILLIILAIGLVFYYQDKKKHN